MSNDTKVAAPASRKAANQLFSSLEGHIRFHGVQSVARREVDALIQEAAAAYTVEEVLRAFVAWRSGGSPWRSPVASAPLPGPAAYVAEDKGKRGRFV